MTGIELLNFLYITGWVLRVLSIVGLLIATFSLAKMALEKKN
jgi:hypothetical protein